MLRLNNPKGAFTAAGSRLSIRRKAGPMGQLAVVRFCRDLCARGGGEAPSLPMACLGSAWWSGDLCSRVSAIRAAQRPASWTSSRGLVRLQP